MKKIAVVFPGQGSQSVGMLSNLANEHLFQNTLSEASEVLKFDVWRFMQDGPEEKLNQTEFTQPVLLAASVALWRVWQSQYSLKPVFLAGHSLGEYSALVAAEAFSFSDALILVTKRGRYMQQAVASGVGAMAAIVGLDDLKIIELCDKSKIKDEVISPANYNSIGQTVISGHATAIDRAIELATKMGAKLAKRLPVSVPSHCPLMRSAADLFKQDLNSVKFKEPVLSVIHNADLNTHLDPYAIRSALLEQLTQPVRWVETIQLFEKAGVQFVIECGPGKVLTGLNKRISSQLSTYPCADFDLLNKAIQAIA